jgi:hypothetical protein
VSQAGLLCRLGLVVAPHDLPSYRREIAERVADGSGHAPDHVLAAFTVGYRSACTPFEGFSEAGDLFAQHFRDARRLSLPDTTL